VTGCAPAPWISGSCARRVRGDDDLELVPDPEHWSPVLRGHRLAGRAQLPVRALGGSPFVRFPATLAGLYDQITEICVGAVLTRVSAGGVQMQTIVGWSRPAAVSIVPARSPGSAAPMWAFAQLRP